MVKKISLLLLILVLVSACTNKNNVADEATTKNVYIVESTEPEKEEVKEKEKPTTVKVNPEYTKKDETKKTEENKPKEDKQQEVKKEDVVETQTTIDYLVATTAVNVRTGDNTESQVIGKTKAGDVLNRLSNQDNGWSKVEYQGSVAYVKSEFFMVATNNDEVNNIINELTKPAQPERITPQPQAQQTPAPTQPAPAAPATTGKSYVIQNIPVVNQNPELPTGCEVTALTIALNYAGYNVDKCTLSDNYLPKSGRGVYSPTNPHTMFIGEPRDGGSYGCYSEPIVQCAINFGANASNISGTAFDDLFAYIDKNQPVLVWGTMGMRQTTYNTNYQYQDANGNYGWKNGEHCLVLVGYDTSRSVVYLADPLKGAVVEYDLNTVRARYAEQEYQAVIVW